MSGPPPGSETNLLDRPGFDRPKLVTSSGGSDRPDVGVPGRSFRSLSSPADLISVDGGHRMCYVSRGNDNRLLTHRIFSG